MQPSGGPMIPRMRRSIVPRPRLMTLLSDIVDYPLTVVKAGAGYGKTTAFSAFARSLDLPLAWLTLSADEQDPTVFAARMMDTILPNVSRQERERVLEAVHHPLSWDASAQLFSSLTHLYVREDSVYILDDFHLVHGVSAILRWLDVWLRRLPETVHVVLLSRTEPTLAAYHEHSLRGNLLLLRERDLLFTADELRFLFQTSPDDPASGLDSRQLMWLEEHTGGMPMVLSLLWRQWRQHGQFALLQTALTQSSSVREQVGTLFLADLSEDERIFFTCVSVLPTLIPDLCDALLDRTDSASVLSASEKKGFLVTADEPFSYVLHPLVREYLQSLLNPSQRSELIWRAVIWHKERGQQVRAISYLFSLDDETAVIAELLQQIPDYLAHGQVATVQGWLEKMGDDTVATSPGLLWAQAEVARFANHYADARHLYEKSRECAQRLEDARWQTMAHIGQARLYLDTIQPSLAEGAIQEAQRSLLACHADLRVTILQLHYENAINSGRYQRATRLGRVLQISAKAAVCANNSDARLLLRTGRILEATQLLESRLRVDRIDQRTALSHREATLLLSLLYSLAGEPLAAREQALCSFTVGDTLHSPFVQAVGYIRLGHAHHLFDPLAPLALQAYDQAMALMEDLHIVRGQSEALMGQSLAHAYQRQFELARACAERGIAIAERVEDRWMASLVRLAYGQGCCVNQMYDEAQEVLARSATAFASLGDPYLTCAALLWRAQALTCQGVSEANDVLARAIEIAEREKCTAILSRPTYFGLRDLAQVPSLVSTYTAVSGWPSRMVESRMNRRRSGMPSGQVPPSYSLRVQTFGSFHVWRGVTEVSRKEWQREKARQLFQYLLTRRNTWLHREEIMESLWGERDREAAERDFKVALSTLSQALEPDREGRGTTSFIAREGSAYQLVDQAGLDVDSDRFVHYIEQAKRTPNLAVRTQALWAATETYQGEYMQEARYLDWADGLRERYRRLFLQAAVEYATACLEQQSENEAIRICERALQVEPAWEEAYVRLMQAYGNLHNRPMVVQTYRNCKRVMEQEYGLDVSDETTATYREWT